MKRIIPALLALVFFAQPVLAGIPPIPPPLAPTVSVTTLAALASAPTNKTVYLVQGNLWGTFAWASGDQSANVTLDPQQGVWVAPTSDATGASGAWQRVGINGAYNPEWFGATTSDATGTTNQTAIQAAMDYAYNNGHENRLQFPAGDYLTCGIIFKYGVGIRGATSPVFNETSTFTTGTRLKLCAASTTPLLYNVPLNGSGPFRQTGSDGHSQYYYNVEIRDITLDANAASSTSSKADALRIDHVWSVSLENSYLKAGGRGFALHIIDSNTISVRNNSFLGPSFMWSVADSDVSHNQMGGLASGNNVFWPTWWDAAGSKNVIVGNLIFNNTGNIGAAAYTFTVASSVLTLNASHSFNTSDPVTVSSTGTLPSPLVAGVTYFVYNISPTTISLATTGANAQSATLISLSGGSGTFSLQGGGNANVYLSGTDQTNYSLGRYDEGYGSGIILDGVSSRNVVTGNIIQDSGTGGSASTGAQFINGSISNTFIGNELDGGNYDGTSHQTIGIGEDSTSTGNILSPNTVFNHSTANVQIAGSINEQANYFSFQPNAFQLISGAPTLVTTIGGSRRVGWSFPNTTKNGVAINFQPPPGCAKIEERIRWVNMGAGTGSVNWLANFTAFAPGGNLNAVDTNTPTTTTVAGAQDILTETVIAATAVPEGQTVFLRLFRDGTNGADTLGNAAGMVGVVVGCLPQ